MKKSSLGYLLLPAMMALGGCATMSGEECATGDWEAIGYEDGARGLTTEQFSSRRKACAKHGITPDFRAYQEGRDEGLVEYCQPGRGYSLGARGQAYHGVCDVALEEEFLDAYRVGQQLYSLQSAVDRGYSSIRSRESRLSDIEAEISDSEAALISEDTTTEERVRLLADLKRLSEQTGELEAEIEELHRDVARAELELAEYRNVVASFGY